MPGRAGEVLGTVREIVPLGGDRAAFVARTSDDVPVLVVDDAGVQTLVAHGDDPAPGGGVFGPLGIVHAAAGRVLFTSGALYAWDGSAVRRVIGADDALPRGGPLGELRAVSGSDGGEVLVLGSQDVYFQDASGTGTTVLRFLDPVPGDPTFTVDAIGRAEISSGGIVSIECTGTNDTRSLFRRYVLQGSASALTPAASTLDTPAASGDFALHAISRSGAIAYEYVYTTSDTGPTIEHRELWIESAGSAIAALALVDETAFPADDRFMRFGFTSARLSSGLRLFVHGAADAVSGAPSALTVRGTEWHVVHRDDQPLPAGTALTTTLLGVSADGQALLSAGVGDTAALYVWSESSGLGRLVGANDVLEGRSEPTTTVGGGGMGDDGQVAFVASYPSASGGVEVGGFMTGSITPAETDLRAVTFEAETLPDAGGVDLVRLVLGVQNAGPTAAAFEVRLVSSSAPLASPSACTVPSGSCTCSSNTCRTDRPLPVGDTVQVLIAYDRTASTHVTATVTPIGATETRPADNEIALGAAASSGCSAAPGTRGLPAALVLAAMAWLAGRVRRARAR